MFRKILLPVDGSDQSFKAVEKAISLSEKYGSEVTAIFVVVFPIGMTALTPEIGTIPQQVVEDLEAEGREVLEKVQARFKTKINLMVKNGNPPAEILKESENGYDLIAIGSRGLGEIRGFLLGSVSAKVTHYAKIPVLVVH